jgi:hypothetical protein
MLRTRRVPALSFLAPLVAAALALGGAGCTSERAPRSFVQPNALKKADLEGTWYYIQTVLDAPPTSATAFVGLSTDLLKIKFDVQEDTLYARRAYEQITGSEDTKSKSPTGYIGEPLAAWHISSQFDVIRDYNPTTGEQTNKIIESTERPWSQREFVRVDWSKNLVNNYSGLFFDDVAVEAVSYWESDPGQSEAIHLERATATDTEFTAGQANYMDLTNKLVLTPASRVLCFPDGSCFSIPACFLPYQLADCSDSVLKVRHSFAKVSDKHQYEARNWDGHQMDLFGLWDVGLNRFSYNRNYGVTNSGITRHAARFNVWKQSFDDKGNKIPYANRAVRTIPYYADTSGPSFPDDMFVQSQGVIDQWNAAVGTAIADVRGTPTKERVFVWCHNPVKTVADKAGDADPEACKADIKPSKDAKGNDVYVARQGDPRRSRIFWVNEMQLGGPLGYGPPLFDPETGETISGQAYIYGAALDTYASRARDLVLLLTNRITSDQFIQGVNVKEWVTQNQSGLKMMPPTLDATELNQRLNAMDFSWAKGLTPGLKIDATSPAAFAKSFESRRNALYNTGIFGRSQSDLGAARRAKAQDTVIEAMMITPDLLSVGTGSPVGSNWSTLSETEKMRVSPLRAPQMERIIAERNRKLGMLGFDFAEFADEGVLQRAFRLAKENGANTFDPDQLWTRMRKDIFLAVTLHEVGHNVGLRHNFRGSYDSLNYSHEYWDLRSKGATSARKFAGYDPKTGLALSSVYGGGAACQAGKLSPRYVDCPGGALSSDEAEGGIAEYAYSTVMDYGSNFNSDISGLGHYDKAAMKFSYAGDGYVEVFTKTKPNSVALNRLASLQYFSGSYGFPSPIYLFSSNDALVGIAYHTYPQIFAGGAPDIEQRSDVPYSEITTDQSNLLMADKQGRAMVPYYFCGDEYVGNLTCMRFDSGADAYEQAHDLISRYENYYLINNFKRDRYPFYTSESYRSNVLGRYLEPIRQQMTWYTLFRSIFTDSGGETLFGSDDGWANFTVAVTEGFDLFGRIITQPDAGKYQPLDASLSETPFPSYTLSSEDPTPDPTRDPKGTVMVNVLDGKWSTSTWDFNGCGYYWADECQSRIGYFLDKTFAIETLTDSMAYFTGRDTSVDVRLYAIGYILPFKNQLTEKFGALLAGDVSSFAPAVMADGKTIIKPSWAIGPVGQTTGSPPSGYVDPAAGFTLQLYAGVYGLAGFPATFDQTFVDATRIFIVGNGEAPIPDAQLMLSPGVAGPQATYNPAELVSANPPGAKGWMLWTDQATGKTYAARALKRGANAGSAASYRFDVGVRMLQMAGTLESQSTTSCANAVDAQSCAVKKRAFENYRQNIDIMRSLHNTFGYARYTTDAPFYF